MTEQIVKYFEDKMGEDLYIVVDKENYRPGICDQRGSK